MHWYFDFINTETGKTYEPPATDIHMIPHPSLYEISYTNASRFITLFTGIPYRVERTLYPRSGAFGPMEVGQSYRIQLHASSASLDLWWARGRKWQVLRWNALWPFGSPSSTYEYVLQGERPENIPPIKFSCEGESYLVTVVDLDICKASHATAEYFKNLTGPSINRD